MKLLGLPSIHGVGAIIKEKTLVHFIPLQNTVLNFILARLGRT